MPTPHPLRPCQGPISPPTRRDCHVPSTPACATTGMNKNLLMLLLPLATGLPAWGADSVHAGHGSAGQKSTPVDREKMWQSALARAPLSASTAFDAKGRVWLATVKDGAVWVSHSENRGKNFSTPGRVHIT